MSELEIEANDNDICFCFTFYNEIELSKTPLVTTSH